MSQSQLLMRKSELKNNLSLEMVRVRENQVISYEIRITEYKIYPLKNILMSKSFDSIEGASSLFDKLNN